MKAKKIIKAFKQVKDYCDKKIEDDCYTCPFHYPCNDREWCAVEEFRCRVGWEAFQIGAKEVFND